MATEAVWRVDWGDRGDSCRRRRFARSLRPFRRSWRPWKAADWAPTMYRDQDGALVAYAAIPFESLGNQLASESAETMSSAVDCLAKDRTVRSLAGMTVDAIDCLRESQHDATWSMVASARSKSSRRRWRKPIDIADGAKQFTPISGRSKRDKPSCVVDGRVDTTRSVAARQGCRRRITSRPTGACSAEPARSRTQLGDAQTELDYLDQVETMALLASSYEEIENVLAEWEAFAGPERGKPSGSRKRPPGGVRPISDSDGNLVYIGKTGPQNDRVTFDIAGPDDWWLHARGVPGSHVIVRGNGREPGDDALERAAALAAFFSKSRTSGKVEVDIARRRDVRKIKGAGPGMVTYRNERTVLVSPADESSLERQVARRRCHHSFFADRRSSRR